MALQKTIIIALIITAVIILTSQTAPQLFSSVGNIGEIEPLPGNNTYQFTYIFGPEFGADIECDTKEGCWFSLEDSPKTIIDALRSPPWNFKVVPSKDGKTENKDAFERETIAGESRGDIFVQVRSAGNLNAFFPKLDGTIEAKEELMDVLITTPNGKFLLKPGTVTQINPFIRVQYRPIINARFPNNQGTLAWIRDFQLLLRFQFDMQNGMRVRYAGPT